MSTIRFSEALQNAKAWAERLQASLPNGTTLVRDLYGRIRFAFPEEPQGEISEVEVDALLLGLGEFSPDRASLFISADQLVAPQAIFSSKELTSFGERLKVLDRMISGSNWILGALPDAPPRVKRATFYGLKGGVGRSTALATFAIHLATKGQRVLVIDLDLESPGIGSLLSNPNDYPRFGVVDWFVEDAVGQSDAELLENMSMRSPLCNTLEGEILITPAHGNAEKNYIEKLARTTLGLKSEGVLEQFGDRLNRMIDALEEHLNPTVVLFDSRAGLHDIAAITLSRLGATAFLFAANGIQTWEGYKLLFQHWKNHYQVVPSFRDNLRIVDALVPETERAAHRISATESSYTLFLESIYEEVPPGGTEDAEIFSFDENDSDAPHFPIPIYWNRAFQGYNPAVEPAIVTTQQVDASYGEFVSIAERTLGL